MKKYLYILIFTIISLFSDFYSLTLKPLVQYKTHLSISINPNCNSQYINYAIITESNGRIIKTRFISGSEFIRIGMGKQPSKANNTGENMFKKFKIKDCLYKYDSSQCLKTPDLKLFDLWALKYNINPYRPPDCTPAKNIIVDGFEQHKYRPSWPQIQILQKYGITYINDFFIGKTYFNYMQTFKNLNGDLNISMP
jgi:hypothetical protein